MGMDKVLTRFGKWWASMAVPAMVMLLCLVQTVTNFSTSSTRTFLAQSVTSSPTTPIEEEDEEVVAVADGIRRSCQRGYLEPATTSFRLVHGSLQFANLTYLSTRFPSQGQDKRNGFGAPLIC